MPLSEFQQRVTIEGLDEFDRLTENRSKSAIVLTIHWETGSG